MKPPSLPLSAKPGEEKTSWNCDMQDFLGEVVEYTEHLLNQQTEAAALARALQELFDHIEINGPEPGSEEGQRMTARVNELGQVIVEHQGSADYRVFARQGDRWVDPEDPAPPQGDLVADALAMAWWGDIDMIMDMTQ